MIFVPELVVPLGVPVIFVPELVVPFGVPVIFVPEFGVPFTVPLLFVPGLVPAWLPDEPFLITSILADAPCVESANAFAYKYNTSEVSSAPT